MNKPETVPGLRIARSLMVLLALVPLSTAADARALQIVAEDYPPATFEEEGQVRGLDVDVARAVFDRLGVAYEFHLYPWARTFEMLKDGTADVGLHVSQAEDRVPFVMWPQTAVWNADFVLYAREATKASHPISSYADAQKSGLTIGIINRNAYNPGFWQAFPSPDRENQHYNPVLEPAADAETNMRKLAADRIQLFPLPQLLGKYMVHQMHLRDVTSFDWIMFSKPYPNVFSKKSTFSDAKYPDIQALMAAYDQELARLKSNGADYAKFRKQYE